ncbi:MAG: hypothetical protein OJF62_001938 [Pseudolabrys sp.]|jgi:hypothetical protein|nr:hypothetical protein [Pseudolabrys sp.]
MLLFISMAATLVAVYWFWIRPILRSRPAFRELYQEEENFLAALREKFAGIKQKLSSAIVIAASAIVSGYDFFAPIVSGVDVSSIAAQVPSWAWPLILIAVTAVMKYFRDLADRRHEIELGNGSLATQEK